MIQSLPNRNKIIRSCEKGTKMRCRLISVLLMMLPLLNALNSEAQVYKWVDKDGKVQYTDSPPPSDARKSSGRKLELAPDVKPSKADQERSQSWIEEGLEFKNRRLAEDEKKANEEHKAKVIEQFNKTRCKNARSQRQFLQTPGILSYQDDKGDRVYVDENQRNAVVARLEQFISAECK